MKSPQLKLFHLIMWSLLALLISCSPQSSTVTHEESPDGVSRYDIPQFGLSFEYPDNFTVKVWDHPDLTMSASILRMTDLESGGGMLPEVFISVHENNENVSLKTWIEQSNVEGEFPFYDNPDFVHAENINGIDVLHFTEHDFMGMDIQHTLFETQEKTYIIDIGYVQMQRAYIARVYWQVLESMTLE